MIPVSELRIGNWVNRLLMYANDPIQVSAIGKSGIDYEENALDYRLDNNYIYPIELTPTILGRIGFTYSIWRTYDINIGPDILSIDLEEDKGKALIHYNCIHDAAGGKAKILYLHQLQNLYYALTGEDLNITL